MAEMDASVKYLRVRNFEKFQHYRDRHPPWIKLYRDLWDDPRFFELSEAERYFLITFFIVASQNDNRIPANPNWLKREMATYKVIPIDSLVLAGWLEWVEQPASTPLASRLQTASNEVLAPRLQAASTVLDGHALARPLVRDRDRSTETETETETPKPPFSHFGEFRHVCLSAEDVLDLQTRLNGSFETLVQELDRYGETHPVKFRKYKNHKAVLLSWHSRRGKDHGESRESPAEAQVRRTKEAGERALAQFAAGNRGNLRS